MPTIYDPVIKGYFYFNGAPPTESDVKVALDYFQERKVNMRSLHDKIIRKEVLLS
jgi:hypothetical protein